MRAAFAVAVVSLAACGGAPGARPAPAQPAPAAQPSLEEPPATKPPDEKQVDPAASPLLALGTDDLPFSSDDPCDETGRKRVEKDLDNDGKPDMVVLVEEVTTGGTITQVRRCQKTDLNHDGSFDFWGGYSEREQRLYERFDFDFDGRFEVLQLYDETNDVLREVYRDTDDDGVFDMLEEHDMAGDLVRISRDRNGDGQLDMWENYKGGTIYEVEIDDDHDGRPDRTEKP